MEMRTRAAVVQVHSDMVDFGGGLDASFLPLSKPKDPMEVAYGVLLVLYTARTIS